MEINKLYLGDNLIILKEIPSESVDLIYLDPPFFTQTDWEKNGMSFSDKFKDINDYVEFMSIRLKELHRILKTTGTIYLHANHRAIHYLKLEMDKIFNNYQTMIVWQRVSGAFGQKSKNIFVEVSEYIIVYTKSEIYTYNSEQEISNIWTDIDRLNKIEYPTQKPEALLERIIKASSNPNDIVLDPFCGSGTTCVVSKKLGRNYIGIDSSQDAINLSEKRIKEIPIKQKSLFEFWYMKISISSFL